MPLPLIPGALAAPALALSALAGLAWAARAARRGGLRPATPSEADAAAAALDPLADGAAARLAHTPDGAEALALGRRRRVWRVGRGAVELDLAGAARARLRWRPAADPVAVGRRTGRRTGPGPAP